MKDLTTPKIGAPIEQKKPVNLGRRMTAMFAPQSLRNMSFKDLFSISKSPSKPKQPDTFGEAVNLTIKPKPLIEYKIKEEEEENEDSPIKS